MKVLKTKKKKYSAHIIIQFMQMLEQKKKNCTSNFYSYKAQQIETDRITCTLIVFTQTYYMHKYAHSQAQRKKKCT